MYESHASYSACGLGSDGTDRLVALAREAGVDARHLRRQDYRRWQRRNRRGPGRCHRRRRVRAIALEYASRDRPAAYVFEGTSPGAARVGTIRLDPA